jgi:hypothetical protein
MLESVYNIPFIADFQTGDGPLTQATLKLLFVNYTAIGFSPYGGTQRSDYDNEFCLSTLSVNLRVIDVAERINSAWAQETWLPQETTPSPPTTTASPPTTDDSQPRLQRRPRP